MCDPQISEIKAVLKKKLLRATKNFILVDGKKSGYVAEIKTQCGPY